MQSDEERFRRIFLEQFVLFLIKNIPVKIEKKRPIEIKEEKIKLEKKPIQEKIQQKKILSKRVLKVPKPVYSTTKQPVVNMQPSIKTIEMKTAPPQNLSVPVPTKKTEEPKKQIDYPVEKFVPPQLLSQSLNEKEAVFNFSYLMPFFKNANATGLECPGPGKPLILKKNGKTEITGVSLTAEQIKKIIEEISEETRIPAKEGIYRVSFNGNLVLTAVISELAGTRFLIEKNVALPSY